MHRKLLSHALIASLVYATTPFAFGAGSVATDGTIGAAPATTVVLGATLADTYDIVEALGERSGSNLFHSFLTFNIDVGETALFSENVLGTTTNVISRVTGGSGSLIDGTISNIAGANFWFVDTAGVMIGANAVFDVSGALSIGSVDFIEFAGGERFYALPPVGGDGLSVLNVNPLDFGFLDPTSAGDLTITGLMLDDTVPGSLIGDIKLAGNNVTITDSMIINDPEASGSDITINAPGNLTLDITTLGTTTSNDFDAGNITLTGGTVALNDGTSITSVASGVGGSTVDPLPGILNPGSIGQSGHISITGAAGVTSNIDPVTGLPDTSLAAVTISTAANNEDSVGAGTVTIETTAGDVFLSNTSVSSTTLTNLAPTDGAITGGISLLGSNDLTLDDVDVTTSTTGGPASGNINATATAGSVWIRNGSFVSSATTSTATGASGLIAVSAATDVTIDSSTINTSTQGESDAGDIDVNGNAVALNDGTTISSTASGAGGSTADPDILLPASIGQSGHISITGAAGVTSNIDSVTGLPDTALTAATISTTANNVDSVGAGTVSIEATAGNVFLWDTSVASTTLTDLGGGVPGAVSIAASGGLTLDDVSVDTSSQSAADAGTIQLTGFDVSFNNGTQLIARGEIAGSGAAGDIDVNATNRVLVNVDPVSLLAIAGASVLVDTSAAGASSGGSDLTISAGDVLLSNFNVNANNSSAATSPDLGTVSITAIGGGATAGALEIENSFLNGDSSSNGSAPTMLLSSVTTLDITTTTILDATFGTGAGGVIDIIAGTDLTISSLTILNESFSTGNAGAINLSAGGDLSLTGANLETPSVIGSAGEAGTIDLSAGGSLTLASSTLSAPAHGTGDAGTIRLSGDSLTMTLVSVTTTTASNTAPLSPDAGDISVDVIGAIELTNSTLQASSTGDSAAGDISFVGTSFFMDGGEIAAQNTSMTGATGAAGSITFNDVLNPLDTFTIIGGGDILASAGTDGLSATPIAILATGAVKISGTSTDEAEVKSSAANGTAANIDIQGSSITLANALISTEAGGTSVASGASISLTAEDPDGAGVDLTNTSVIASTSGTPNAGDINIIGPTFQMSGGSLQSSTSGGGRGGIILVNWPTPVGAVSITDALLSASSTGTGDAGFMIIAGERIDVRDSLLEANATETDTGAGFVALVGDNGISVTNSTLTAISSGAAAAGGLTGGSVYLLNGFFAAGTGNITLDDSMLSIDQRPETTAPAAPLCVGCIPPIPAAPSTGFLLITTPGSVTITNTTLSSTTSGLGTAGDILIEGADFTMTGGLLQSSTTGMGNAGNILIAGPGSFGSPTPTAIGSVTLSAGATIKATAGDNTVVGTYGNAGTIDILSDSAIVLSGTDATNPVEISSSSFIGAGLAGAITLSGSDLTASFSRLSTETATSTTSGSPASINLQFSGGDVLLSNTAVVASTSGATSAGDVTIDAASITALGTLAVLDASGTVVDQLGIESSSTAIDVAPAAAGAAGSILFTADSLILGTEVVTSTTSDIIGNTAGSITAIITGAIMINGGSLEASTTGDSDAGSISLAGNDVLFDLAPLISAASNSGKGAAGSISIIGANGVSSTVAGVTITSSANSIDSRGAGSIEITAGALDPTTGAVAILADVSLINADISSSTSSNIIPLVAGAVTIEATGNVIIDGSTFQTESDGGSANSGNITIGGIDNGAAASISLNDSAFLADATAGGAAGGVTFTATGAITATGGLSVRSLGLGGSAGTIRFEGQTIDLRPDVGAGSINASSEFAAGGSIEFAASDQINLVNMDVQATSAGVSAAGAGTAGSITFSGLGGTPTTLLTVTNTTVSSAARGLPTDADASGSAGNILMLADIVRLDGSTIDSRQLSQGSAGGASGTITIDANIVDIVNSALSTATASNNLGIPAGGLISVTATTTATPGTGVVNMTDSTLTSSTSGAMRAGDIIISAEDVNISGGTLASSSSGPGNGGNIFINFLGGAVSGILLISNGAEVLAESTGNGSAGFIIAASDSIDVQNSTLSAAATGGASGFVALIAESGISITDNSSLNASADGMGAASGTLQSDGSIYVWNGFFSDGTGDINIADSALNIDLAGDAVAFDSFILLTTPGSVSLTNTTLSSTTADAAGDAGRIAINGSDFMMTGGSLQSSTTGTGNAGSIEILGPGSFFSGTPTATGQVTITGGADIRATAGEGPTGTGTYGNAGKINIMSDAAIILAGVDASDLAEISSSSSTGAGQAETVTLSGTDLTASFAELSTETASTTALDTASIDLDFSGDISFTDSFALASTSGATDAGDIFFKGTSFTMAGGLIESSTRGEGNAGSVSIAGPGSTPAAPVKTGQVTITGGADIRATAGEGPAGTGTYGIAGTIDIQSDSAIILTGDASDPVEISSSSFTGAGQAGTLTISGTNLTSSFVELSTETASTSAGKAASIDLQLSGDVALMDTLILASTSGSIDAGDVTVNGSAIDLSSNTLVAASSSANGNAGNVGLFATDSINMSVGTVLGARSTGPGNAGSVTLDAGNVITITGATVASSSLGAGVGVAGTVTLDGAELILTDAFISTETDSDDDISTSGAIVMTSAGSLFLDGTRVTASTTGEADASSITLTAVDIDLANGAAVLASTSGGGRAGDVSLIAGNAINLPEGMLVAAQSTGSGDAGSVTLDAGGLISITGATVESSSLGVDVGVAGTVTLNAAELILTNAFISTQTDSNDDLSPGGAIVITSAGNLFLDGTRVTASTTGAAAAGSITLDALNIDLANQAAVLASTSGGGNAGNVTLLATNTINLPDGMLVAARSTGAGNAGSVTLEAGGLISITGATVQSSSLRDDPGEAVGLAGFVTIQGGNVAVTNALISTSTDSDIPEDQVNTPDDQPEPGAITLVSDSGVLLDGSTIQTVTTGMADAGDILIEALGADIDLSNASTATASTSGGGDAGDVTLIAAGAINLPIDTEVSAKSTGPGDAGSVTLVAGGVLTIDNALVTSSSEGSGVGTAGNIDLGGSHITLTNALVSTQSSSDLVDPGDPDHGDAADVRPGTITVNSPGRVYMKQGSRLSASVSGAADGGDILITANDLTLIEGSVIETRATGTGNSGSVTLVIANDLTLVTPDEATLPTQQSAILTNSLASQGGTITADIGGVLFMDRSRIESSVGTADGKGGDIVLTTNGLFMVGSQILARADQGNGGAIFINRGNRTPDPATDTPFDGLFIIDAESLINADSEAGVSGEVNIDSPDADLTAVVEVVDARIVEDPTLADDVCNPSTREAQSSFIVEDQGGVAPSPDGYFSAGVLSAEGGASQIAQGGDEVPADVPLLLAAAGGCK